MAPSAVGLDLRGNYARPRALEEDEILSIVRRFATAAALARDGGYGGVQVHPAHVPLMVTGGFRSRAGMEAALASGDTDLIGLARPLCSDPDAVRRLLERSIDTLPADERRLHLAAGGWLSAGSPIVLMKVVNVIGAQGLVLRADRTSRRRPRTRPQAWRAAIVPRALAQ